MRERRPELPSDVFQLVEMGVPEGVAIRAGSLGFVPDRGPGRHSIPRAFDTAARNERLARYKGKPPPSF